MSKAIIWKHSSGGKWSVVFAGYFWLWWKYDDPAHYSEHHGVEWWEVGQLMGGN